MAPSPIRTLESTNSLRSDLKIENLSPVRLRGGAEERGQSMRFRLISRSILRGSWHLARNSRPAGCRGFKGPIPPPLSMSARTAHAGPDPRITARGRPHFNPKGPPVRAGAALAAGGEARQDLARVARRHPRRYQELPWPRGLGPPREHVVVPGLYAPEDARVELAGDHHGPPPAARDVLDALVGVGVELPCPLDLEPHERDETVVHDAPCQVLLPVPEALEVLEGQIYPPAAPVLGNVAQEIGELHGHAEGLGVRVGPPVVGADDPAHHKPDDGGAPVGVDLEVPESLVAEDAGVHLHALHKRRYVDRLAGDGGHRLPLEGLETPELLPQARDAGVVHDLVGVAHKRVQGMDPWPDVRREEACREVVRAAVGLLDLTAQLVALREREALVELHAARGVEPHDDDPTSRPMRSAASLAPMVTSGTPVPGRVLAPTKYMPSTLRETNGGRKYPTWRMPWPIPNAAPSSRL